MNEQRVSGGRGYALARDTQPGINHVQDTGNSCEMSTKNDHMSAIGSTKLKDYHPTGNNNAYTPGATLVKSSGPGETQPATSPHCEWGDITTLGLPKIETHLNDLLKRCATNRSDMDSAITQLDTSIQNFLSKASPMSTEDLAAFFQVFTVARIAGFSLFSPQEEYRNAIATLSILIRDIIKLLPDHSEVKIDMEDKLDGAMEKANKKEEMIRERMRRIGKVVSAGGNHLGLMVYLQVSRDRLQNWSEVEDRMTKWAKECVDALK